MFLTSTLQAAATKLGFLEPSWNVSGLVPPFYDQLSTSQKGAVSTLGYDAGSWDKIPRPVDSGSVESEAAQGPGAPTALNVRVTTCPSLTCT